MLDITLPKGNAQATQKSQLRLSSEHKSIECVISSFEDGTASRRVDGVFKDSKQASLRLSFPSLETDNNTYSFNLRFPNKTVKDIATEIYLFDNVRSNPPQRNKKGEWANKTSEKIGNAILSMCDKDGVVLHESIEDFVANYKLSGSTSKIYSTLRENKISWDLSKFSESLKGQTIKVQSYYNDKMKDYTICTTDYSPKKGTKAPQPTSTRGGSLW
tara:strand:- start:813 stop:1460 length:648 start_codon:yes stop_codon:yes gene_type:complete